MANHLSVETSSLVLHVELSQQDCLHCSISRPSMTNGYLTNKILLLLLLLVVHPTNKMNALRNHVTRMHGKEERIATYFSLEKTRGKGLLYLFSFGRNVKSFYICGFTCGYCIFEIYLNKLLLIPKTSSLFLIKKNLKER